MFNIAILDSDTFSCKGVTDYFSTRDIRTFSCSNLAELESTLQGQPVHVVIAELATVDDTLFSCIDYLTHLTCRWPDVRLILFTHFTDPVLMRFVVRHVPHCNLVLKSDSFTQLASCIFASDSGNKFNSSSQAMIWEYLSTDSRTLTPEEFRLLENLACEKNSQRAVVPGSDSIMLKLGCQDLTELQDKLGMLQWG